MSENLISNIAFERIVNLLSKGYDIRLQTDFCNQIEIRITKGGINASHFVTIDELRQVKIDYMLYVVNRMVDMIDEGIKR